MTTEREVPIITIHVLEAGVFDNGRPGFRCDFVSPTTPAGRGLWLYVGDSLTILARVGSTVEVLTRK